jgi:cytochrome c556
MEVAMKTCTLWITAIALCLAACSKQEPIEPQRLEKDQAAVPAEEIQEAKAAAIDEAFINHMHEHAAKLDDLMFALADGDLEGAATPAYWLSQHDTVDGVPEELQDFVTSMRNAAYDVEMAEDLDTARAAAEEITAQCQACHAAAGVRVLR